MPTYRCMYTIKKHKNRKCKKNIYKGNYCKIHRDIVSKNNQLIEEEIGICCFCKGQCNPCSQACGKCARMMTAYVWKN